MRSSTKRLLSVLIVLAMALSMMPVFAFAAGETTTVYCQVPDGWTKCNAYWWGGTGASTTWPGEAMTEVEDGIWSFEVPSDATGLIFNNGSTQTGNLTVPTDDKVMYVFANSYWTTYGKVEVVTEYFVAGSAGLCGVAWAPGAAENKLADPDGDGVYTITYSGIAAGSYEFKITNGSWAESWGLDGGNANQPLVLTATNNTVNIRFDSATKLLKVIVNGQVVIEPTEPSEDPSEDSSEDPSSEPVAAAYYVAGTFNGWNAKDDAFKMVDNGDGTYALTFAVTAGKQSLKVTNGTWDSSWGGTGEGGNYDILVNEDGEITVSFDGTTVTVTGDCLGEEEPVELVIEAVYAVGQEGLTGADWDPAANAMTNTDGVYTITFTDIAAGTYEFKFAANGGWDINWAAGVEMTSGETYDAWFKAMGNNTVVIPADGATVTLTLDLTTMDAITGEGGKCSVTITGVELPDPSDPSNPSDPTDPSDPVETAYYVAGTFNGWNEKDEAYKMVDNGDGTYTLTFAVTAGNQSLKVTNGTWDSSWGGTGEGGNYDILVNEDGEITVSFDGTTVTVTGDCLGEIVKDPLVIENVYAVGSEGLMGAGWDPTANAMTNTDGVYTITFTDIAAGTYEFKFAANGAWDINWAAGVEMTSGEIYDAWFNAMGNSSVVIEKDGSTVTLTLDLTTMDAVTGEGGKCSVTVEAPASSEGVTVSGTATAATDGVTTIELVKDGVVLTTGGADGKKGDYAFENVAAGEYILRISKPNHVTREYTVVVADEDVTQDVKICLLGDVTGDGRVNIGDAAKIYSHSRGTAVLTDEYQMACANVNGGKLNIGDAASLYSHCRGTKKLY